MGCPLSHDQPPAVNNTISNNMLNPDPAMDAVDYKAKLERKMCWSKETPEEIFDLAGCNLKEVPPGVFVVCGVLRKRELLLNDNRLHNLKGGGLLQDLHLLTCLNLSENQFKKLPDDIFRLENLRELFVSNNLLNSLPQTINKLKKLEILDVSHNKLQSIHEVAVMPHLRVLNVMGNVKLNELSTSLATCSDLTDIVFDIETIEEPPAEICRGGTANILKYLSTGEVIVFEEQPADVTDDSKTLMMQAGIDEAHQRFMALKYEKAGKERSFLEMERIAAEKDYEMEAKFQVEQMKRRKDLLQKMQEEQTENEEKVFQLQQIKESERSRLIADIIKEEENTKKILENLLCLRNGPDQLLLEREREEQELLLEQLMIQQSALRKQEIITRMTSILDQEMETIQQYQDQRDATSKTILEQEHQSNLLLNDVFQKYDQTRGNILDEISLNEELQKTAVATLIAKNDSRSWGLMEQIKILESELAKLTHLEIEKKKLHIDEHVNDLAARRIEITYVLLDLMDQQDQRKQELIETMNLIEAQRENRPDFWLLQYQKLMDQQPGDLSLQTAAIDPLLGYQFLNHGVVHCLPFLSKIWQDTQTDLKDIDDNLLNEAGVRNQHDRFNILRSIEIYLNEIQGQEVTECLPDEASAPDIDNQEQEETVGQLSGSECVICLDAEVKVLFLPCGHLCCCINCQTTLKECPMCRGNIERRIKVIQS